MVEEIESLKDGGIGLELLDKVCPGARFQTLKLVEKQSEVHCSGALFTWYASLALYKYRQTGVSVGLLLAFARSMT